MALKSFVTQYLGGKSTLADLVRVFNNLQSNLNDIFTYLNKKVQLDNVLLQNITVQNGLNVIPHTLGRTLSGYQIVTQSQWFEYYDLQAVSSNNTATYLYLQVYGLSEPSVISLLVF